MRDPSRRNSHVNILLGTYNGERFLSDQITSIRNQSYQDWSLHARDDQSSDRTTQVLSKFQKLDSRIHIVQNSGVNLGPQGCYNELCEIALHNAADYVFLSDQDDIWNSNKIHLQLRTICEFEKNYSNNCPVLIHTDLKVVDHQLNPIHKSFLSYQKLRNINEPPLPKLLTQNYITACATVLNKALLELATPIPRCALMHDWWIALCAAACGKIGFIDKPMTLYRQHENNTIGVTGGFANIFFARNEHIKVRLQRGISNFRLSIQQARVLKERILERRIKVMPDVLKTIDAYSNCLKYGKLKRLSLMRQNGIRRQGLVYSLLFYLLLLLVSDR